MDTSRNDMLGELAAQAALERDDFLATAAEQLRRFLESNRDRIDGLGGLVLIDDEVDYLAVVPGLGFRSRSRYLDDKTGKWVSEMETIDDPSELIELYNPADIYAAFAEASKEDAGIPAEPTATDEMLRDAGIAPGETVPLGDENPYAGAADNWAAGQGEQEAPQTEEEAAERLYDLALAFQDRSQQTEANLLEQFETAAANITAVLGDLVIVDDEDERLTLGATGAFRAEVVPEDEAESGRWRKLGSAEDIVEFYDPTDICGDLADTLAEAFPALAGEPAAEGGDNGDEAHADGDEAGDDGEDHGDR